MHECCESFLSIYIFLQIFNAQFKFNIPFYKYSSPKSKQNVVVII